MSNIVFNGVDLSTFGFSTPTVGGVHDLAGLDVETIWLPGLDWPSETLRHPNTVEMRYEGVVVGTTHAALVSQLGQLKKAISPRLGFKVLTSVDKQYLQVYAKARSLAVDIDTIPYLRTAVKFPLVFDRYPYWEDISEVSVVVASRNLLTYNQATLDDGVTTGWTVGTATSVNVTKLSSLTYCGVMVSDAVGEEVLTTTGVGGVVVSPTTAYIASAYIQATVGFSYRVNIEWYTAAGAYISTTNGGTVSGDGNFQRHTATATSPGTAARAAVSLEQRAGASGTAYFNDVQLELGSAASTFCIPASGGKIPNAGDVDAYPVYECRPSATLGTGFYFDVTPPGGAAERFQYNASIGLGDVLYVATGPPDVTRNATRDFANTGSASLFTLLKPGFSGIALSSTSLEVTAKFRQRYE